MAFAFLIGLVVMEIVADFMGKQYAIVGNIWLALGALVTYTAANASWLASLRHGSKLSVAANIFSVSTGIVAFIVGVFFYKEAVTASQVVGVILGLFALILLFL